MENSKQIVGKMLTEGANNPKAAMALYLQSLKQGKTKTALFFAKSLTRHFPENYISHHFVVATLLLSKEPLKAETYLESIKNHFGEQHRYLFDLLWCFVELGEMEKALHLLQERKCFADSSSPLYLENSVKVYIHFRDKDNLTRCLRVLAEKYKRENAALCMACIDVMDGNIADALEKVNAIIGNKKQTPAYYLAMSLQPILMKQAGNSGWETIATNNAKILDASARDNLGNFWQAQLATVLWEITENPENKAADEQLIAEVTQLLEKE